MTRCKPAAPPARFLLGLAAVTCLVGPSSGAGTTYVPGYPVYPVPYYPAPVVPVYPPGYVPGSPPVYVNPYLQARPAVQPPAVTAPVAAPVATPAPADSRATGQGAKGDDTPVGKAAKTGGAGNGQPGQSNGKPDTKGNGGKKSGQSNSQAPDLSAMIRAFGQFFTEEEVDLLFDYLRDSTVAALKGDEEVLLPPDLAFKLEILQQRMKKEGAFYFKNLIEQMERDIDRALEDYRNPPPPPPYEPPQYRGSAR